PRPEPPLRPADAPGGAGASGRTCGLSANHPFDAGRCGSFPGICLRRVLIRRPAASAETVLSGFFTLARISSLSIGGRPIAPSGLLAPRDLRGCLRNPSLRQSARFGFEIRFLGSKYPPGIPHLESRISILKPDCSGSKAIY